MKPYTIHKHTKTIELHVPMTQTELCRHLLLDGYDDLVEMVKWIPDDATAKLLRDGGWVEKSELD